MTQIVKVTEKEMLRRTGTNAMGYSYPDKDMVLLNKNLTGANKREVLAHEREHMEKGEEGPFWGSLIGGVTSLLGGAQQAGAAGEERRSREAAERTAQARLSPYQEYGAGGIPAMQEWMATDPFRDPTMEEVQAGPGYASRLGAIESSAAARGGLLSGNALRDIGEFGSSEFGRERERRRGAAGEEYARRMGRIGLGYGAAGGQAGITTGMAPGIAGTYTAGGNAMAQGIGGAGQAIAGGIGERAGQKQWQQFLDRAYPQQQGPSHLGY